MSDKGDPTAVQFTGLAAIMSSTTLPNLHSDTNYEDQPTQQLPVLTPSSVKISSKPVTRKTSTVFGLGSGITKEDCEISGSRLPTNLQVLRCFMYHLQEGAHTNRTKWESAKLVLSKVAVFYTKGSIPMLSERKACKKIIKLLEDNAKLREIPRKRRSTPGSLNKLKQMEDKLVHTFPLWPANVESLIKNTEDLAFLKSMKSDRSATLGPKDKVLASKIKRREEREKLEAVRREKMFKEINISTATNTSLTTQKSSSDEAPGSDVEFESDRTGHHKANAAFSSNIEDEEEAGSDMEYDLSVVGASASKSTSRRHHRTARTGTAAFIPHDIIHRPKLVALATRLKMTPAQQAAYTKALIAEAGGDVSKVAVSYSTADKSRREVLKIITESCKEAWVPPKLATLHWDSKLLPSLANQKVEERLIVVVGNTLELKLLGVPAYSPGTKKKSGDIIANLTVNLLDSWHCTNSIVNMTFDTTASNTGHVSAACVSIQNLLGRALLWSACRHHIGEIILSHVFEDLKIEASRSPDVTLFFRFRKNFSLLQLDDTDALLSGIESSTFTKEAQIFMKECKAKVLELTESVISHNQTSDRKTRDDYLEFVNLCRAFLNNKNEVNFRRPGALHKARWMAKLIYSIKICMFEHQIQQLPIGTITTKQQIPKVRDFVNFVTLIYSNWWMTCDSAVDAPWNDLKLYHSLLQYQVLQPVVSKSAIEAFKNHLWYLTEEMIPLALWSNKVPAASRQALADRILSLRPDSDLSTPQHRFGMGFGKPRLPPISLSTTLADLAGTDSWFIFHLLQLDTHFLSENIADWPNSVSYQTSLVNLQSLNVVNDCAERGVKLSSDFLASAKGEEHYQNVLQVVEQDRKHQPNLRKRKQT